MQQQSLPPLPAQEEPELPLPPPPPVTAPPDAPLPTDSEAVVEAKIIARLRYFEERDRQMTAYTGALLAHDRLLATLDQKNRIIIGFLTKSADKGIAAGDKTAELREGYEKLIKLYETELQARRDEIVKLRHDRDSAFNRGLVLGAGGGAAAAAAIFK